MRKLLTIILLSVVISNPAYSKDLTIKNICKEVEKSLKSLAHNPSSFKLKRCSARKRTHDNKDYFIIDVAYRTNNIYNAKQLFAMAMVYDKDGKVLGYEEY